MKSDQPNERLTERLAAAMEEWRRCWRFVALLFGGAFLLAGCSPTDVLQAQRFAWVETGQTLTARDVATKPGADFRPSSPGQVYPLEKGRTLWLRLEVSASQQDLSLAIPVPLLDFAALHWRDAEGRWKTQVAGDSIPVAQWAESGRFASFLLPLNTQRSAILLQVRHSDPIGFRIDVQAASAATQARQIEYLWLGIMLGTLVLLAAACINLAVMHRDASYAWYAGYAVAMTLTIATVTGISGHLLWPNSPHWANAAQGVLPVLLAAIQLLFLRHLCAVQARYPRFDRLVLGFGLTVLASSALYAFVPDPAQTVIVAVGLLASPVLGLTMAALAWRRRDVVGGLVLLAYVPLAVSVVAAVLRLFGWLPATWLTVSASALTSALAVPLLLLALNARSRERHGTLERIDRLTRQDALTGLMTAEAFERHLGYAVRGALMRQEPAAIVLVEVVNLERIRQAHGDALVEQCLLRAVTKLHRVIRESDPAGRISMSRFAVILEGVASREEAQERMVRLVGSGLVPPPGAQLWIPLELRVACGMLNEGILAPAVLLRRLGRLLDRMSAKTRRPVRFIEVTGAENADSPDGPSRPPSQPSTGG